MFGFAPCVTIGASKNEEEIVNTIQSPAIGSDVIREVLNLDTPFKLLKEEED